MMMPDGDFWVTVTPFGVLFVNSLLLAVLTFLVGRADWHRLTAATWWFATLVVESPQIQWRLFFGVGYIGTNVIETIMLFVLAVTLAVLSVQTFRHKGTPRQLWLLLSGVGLGMLGAIWMLAAVSKLAAALHTDGSSTLEEAAAGAADLYLALSASAIVLGIGVALGIWAERRRVRMAVFPLRTPGAL
jgi:hypothetical protein